MLICYELCVYCIVNVIGNFTRRKSVEIFIGNKLFFKPLVIGETLKNNDFSLGLLWIFYVDRRWTGYLHYLNHLCSILK